MKKHYLLFFLPFFLTSCQKSDNTPAGGEEKKQTINWNASADSSSKTLTSSFWNAGEMYFNDNNAQNKDFHYWPQAHALDVLVDAYTRTNDVFYKGYFDQWYDGVKVKNGNTFKNEFYDDMEWIALAMLRTYKATNDPKFKDATLQIWEYIKVAWNTNAGGGMSWKRDQEYSKNACSNGPACILAARLYQEFGDESNKEWALKIYNWEKSTLFNPANGMVYDNINSETGVVQKNWIFTYNQGTFIGSAVELYKISGEKAYLNDAVLAANYTLSSLVENSLLKNEGTGDGGLFKGIFVRYFVELIQQDQLDASAKKHYIQFLEYNAEKLWNTGTNKPAVLYSPYWGAKPGLITGLTEQLSGSMLIESMALLKKKGIIQ